MERYDIAIVGSGPAGLAAAINAVIRNKKIILFGSKELSSKVQKAPLVNNYLGLYESTGMELKAKFEEHINRMNIEIVEDRINNVYAMGDYFALMSKDNSYEASSVIIATGMEYTKPLPGEEKYLGKGVGYCATCDAPLYKGKTVVIVSYGKGFEEEANFVSELASKVYYVPVYKEPYELNPAIEVVKGRPRAVEGVDKAQKLVLDSQEISADGIFILKESVPPSQLVPGLEEEGGHIKVNRDMSTNLQGCFAAGDCTGKPYQYMKSAGEGQVAALNAVAYLDSRKK